MSVSATTFGSQTWLRLSLGGDVTERLFEIVDVVRGGVGLDGTDAGHRAGAEHRAGFAFDDLADPVEQQIPFALDAAVQQKLVER